MKPVRQRIQANGADLLVERGGTGPTVLFINGTNSAIDRSQILFDILRQSFDLIAFDHRGMGASSIPDGPWTMADYARDAKAVLDGLGVSTCSVLGMSFGGMVALEFGVTFPTYLEKLALWCTSAGGTAGSSYPLHTIATMSPEEQAAISLKLLDSRFSPEWLAANPRDKALVESRPPQTEMTAEQLHAMSLQLHARSTHDVVSRIGAIKVPTLIGAGEFDIMAPPVNAHSLHELLPTSELHFYQGGHLFPFQDKQAFVDLQNFLAP